MIFTQINEHKIFFFFLKLFYGEGAKSFACFNDRLTKKIIPMNTWSGDGDSDITDSDITEFDITDTDIPESDITEIDITRKGKLI